MSPYRLPAEREKPPVPHPVGLSSAARRALIALLGGICGAVVSVMLGGGGAWLIGIAIAVTAILVAVTTDEP
jgi:hypothetical protein